MLTFYLLQVALNKDKMSSDDVYILDLGNKLYQWNGKGCNKDERFKAMQFMSELKSERGDADSETIDEGDEPVSFFILIYTKWFNCVYEYGTSLFQT